MLICMAHYASASNALRHGSHSFTGKLHHACLYFPAAEHHRPLAGTHFTVSRRVEGWVDLGGLLHTEIKCRLWESNPDTVTHPSTNRAQRRLTLLIYTNYATTTPRRHQSYIAVILACVHGRQAYLSKAGIWVKWLSLICDLNSHGEHFRYILKTISSPYVKWKILFIRWKYAGVIRFVRNPALMALNCLYACMPSMITYFKVHHWNLDHPGC